MTDFHHVPILLDAVLKLLNPQRGGIYADGTLGGGGHAKLMLDKLPIGSRIYGIDRDEAAIAAASERLKEYGSEGKFVALRGNFFFIKELLNAYGVFSLDGVLLDLGVSSHQLDTPERGFSYNEDARLDMRMDSQAAFSAYEVVNGYTSQELFRIIKDYGEERYASRIANNIVREREKQPINSTLQLGEIIKRSMPPQARREAQHPAKRTFQAIRIEVNNELGGLEDALRSIESMLNPGGVLAVITFHSLEDRIVKHTFRNLENPCTCDARAPMCTCGKTATSKVLTRKPIVADDAELEANPRARSAKLRAIEKL